MQNKSSMILSSSRKWHLLKKKLGGIVIKDPNFEIKSDGSHCYYLCTKMIHLDNAEVHCEYTNRKDRFSSIQDLEHLCIQPAG